MALTPGKLALPDVLTVERAGPSWYFDESGDFQEDEVIQDVPGSDIYDPSGTILTGWEEFNSATVGSEVVEYADGYGTRRVKLHEVQEDTATGSHGLREANFNITSDQFVVSMLAKDVDRRYVAIWIAEPGNSSNVSAVAEYDLQTGTVSRSNIQGTSGVSLTTGIADLGGGVYRCRMSVDFSPEALTTLEVVIGLSDGTTSFNGTSLAPDYTGDGVSSALVGAPMVTQGTTLRDYVRSGTDLTAAAWCAPVFDHDPGNKNLLLRSEDFSATWATSVLVIGARIAANGVKLLRLEKTSSSANSVRQSVTVPGGAGSLLTASAYFMADSFDDGTLRVYGATTADRIDAAFDLGAGTVTGSDAGGGSLTSADIEDLGGGLFRVSVTGTINNSTVNVQFANATAPNNATIYAGGFQLVERPDAGVYVKTTTAAAAAPLGLSIEGESANEIIQSEDLSNAAWSKTNVAPGSPYTYASSISLDEVVCSAASSGEHLVSQSCTFTAGAVVFFSVLLRAGTESLAVVRVDGAGSFVEAEVDLAAGTITESTGGSPSNVFTTIQPLGEGVYRVGVRTSIATLTSYTGRVYVLDTSTGNRSFTAVGTESIYAGAAQMESGQALSSYIPTSAAAVTRPAALYNLEPLGNWYRDGGYTVTMELMRRPGGGGIPFDITDGSVNNRSNSRLGTSFWSYEASESISNFFNAGVVIGNLEVARGAFRVAPGDYGISVNGASAATNSTPRVPQGIDRARLNNSFNGAGPGTGWIRAFKFTSRLLTNAELQAESQDYV